MNSDKILSIRVMNFPWEAQDPFLFCAYHKDFYPKGDQNMAPDKELLRGRNIGQDFNIKDGWRMYHGSSIPGFPYHPHRGFETITICKQGVVDHSDSLGAAGRFKTGDVQWMTAGKGIQHSEMFPLIHQDKENTLEIFQVWLNLPRSSKFVEPHFKMLWKENIPVLEETDENNNKTIVDVIAGSLKHINAAEPTPDSWAKDPDNEVSVLTIRMEPNAQWTLPAAQEDVSRTLYFYEGENLRIEETNIQNEQIIKLKATDNIFIQNGNQESKLLMLQGKSIGEPIAQYGPFVMNTQQEIQEAFSDYQRTQFGGWPWPEQEQVHEREKGRFALHANGKKEIK